MNRSQENRKIHFIGIGGIGVSALAKYYLAQGFEVSGSDAAESEILEELRKAGVKIPHPNPFLTKEREKKEFVDLMIYSAAVREDDPELVEARARGIKCQTYSQALGELTKKYFTIAISGTHGKSTTTAMIGLILEAAGLDPAVIIGTKVKWASGEFSNYRNGKSKYLVIEADEYAASFLNYWPKIIVLTNIEEDHLDFYTGGLTQIIETFAEYAGHLGKDGMLVANEEDKNISKIKNQKSKLQFKIQNFNAGVTIKGLKLQIPGQHNLANAAAAITVARLLKISDEISVKTLNNFTGTWRRMEYKGEINGAKIYDDYGHHPTEIKATLQGAKELLFERPNSCGGVENFSTSPRHSSGLRSKNKIGRLWCVFQPHQYQRTYQLFEQFVGAFGDADKIIILPIYNVAGREKEEIKRKVNSEMLTERIKVKNKNVIYLGSFELAEKYLKEELKTDDICLIMGAGDIYKLTERLIKK